MMNLIGVPKEEGKSNRIENWEAMAYKRGTSGLARTPYRRGSGERGGRRYANMNGQVKHPCDMTVLRLHF